MEQIKDLTKRLIAKSFKELMAQNPFEKITIKMITDHANVIRPTFYNHFHDKYELVEWILRDEVMADAERLACDGNTENSVRYIFSRIYEDRIYYRKAFEITGQNGFVSTLTEVLSEFMHKTIKGLLTGDTSVPLEIACRYYSSGMISMLRMIIEDEGNTTLEEYLEYYKFLMHHAIYEII